MAGTGGVNFLWDSERQRERQKRPQYEYAGVSEDDMRLLSRFAGVEDCGRSYATRVLNEAYFPSGDEVRWIGGALQLPRRRRLHALRLWLPLVSFMRRASPATRVPR